MFDKHYTDEGAEENVAYALPSNDVSSGNVESYLPKKEPELPIGEKQIAEASAILQEYKSGKANLETRIVSNELWYKLRHWDDMEGGKKDQVKPASGWLFNSIANKHADAMDNFPSPNILPREAGDKAEAEKLSSIIPVILDQCDFEETYSNVWNYKLKFGTGVYGIFWDATKHNGLGDIAIKKIDILNLFWQPGISNVQDSRNLFHVELEDNEALFAKYPQLMGKLGGSSFDTTKYIYDESIKTSDKSLVVDWYYKRFEGGKTILHYCKFVNNEVLYSTENEAVKAASDPNTEGAPVGWYDHGEYPFVFDVLFPVEGMPCGFGYIDVGKSAQEYIDRGNKAILENLLANTKPRFFIRSDGTVKEEEYADMNNDFVHVEGSNLGQDSILPIQGKSLPNVYVQVIKDKIDELKETTGNRDISTGGSASGVTAASAIAAMQEAGSKLSRDANKSAYRAFRKIILQVIELIRQFYDLPRTFRILGKSGAQKFIEYSNAYISPQAQAGMPGMEQYMRLPVFDIEVTAQKQSPYSKMAQNELALQFYKAGFFNPQLSDQALACLDMMDFDRKDFIMQKVAQNGGMYQQMMQMQQRMVMMAAELDRMKGTNIAGQMMAGSAGGNPLSSGRGDADAKDTEALGGEKTSESSTTRKARERVAQSTDPT